jgi:succinate dehydrogenase / fumarate reductase, membrane anchor subunit
VLLLVLIGLTFHHMAAGLQVVVEDYVRDEFKRMAFVLLIKSASLLLAVAAAFSVLRIAFAL